jgi:hypothetical protein
MTATSAVSPGRSASPSSSGSQRDPVVSRAPATGALSPKVTWGCRGECRVGHRRGTPASLAPDTLTTARIVTLAGVTEVHHG